ncbi:hypothetical protein GCM10009565_94460 [Amycolatopsis albidoflavus]
MRTSDVMVTVIASESDQFRIVFHTGCHSPDSRRNADRGMPHWCLPDTPVRGALRVSAARFAEPHRRNTAQSGWLGLFRSTLATMMEGEES